MKRTLIWLAGVAVMLLTMIASVGAASACSWMYYEPEVPAKLRGE
ncbi:MAG: cyclic lactone autoinducer peptide [Firmicutes bacterium]|nr:cyclic lactone autoinducer peptide [Bacillota bacterium]